MSTQPVNSVLPTHAYVVAAPGGIADYYQSVVSIAEIGRLSAFVTDVYFPDVLAGLRYPSRLANTVRRRHVPGLPSHLVSSAFGDELFAYARTRLGRPGPEVHERIGRRAADEVISRKCGAIIYYNHWPSFEKLIAPSRPEHPLFVVQYHPVPSQVRDVLKADREMTGLSEAMELEEQLSDEYIASYEASLRTADGMITASSFVRDGLLSIGVEPERIRVVPYGGKPHDPRFVKDGGTLCTRYGLSSSEKTLRLLWVGSLVYRKGPHHLAEALRQLKGENFTLTVVARFSRYADPFQGVDGVSFIRDASVGELSEIYANHDLLCLPSLAEGFGMVIAEALGAGLPVLATTATGARDIVIEGVNGLVVPPGDTGAIAHAIAELVSDTELRRTLRDGARSTCDGRSWSIFRKSFARAVAELEDVPLRGDGGDYS